MLCHCGFRALKSFPSSSNHEYFGLRESRGIFVVVRFCPAQHKIQHRRQNPERNGVSEKVASCIEGKGIDCQSDLA